MNDVPISHQGSLSCRSSSYQPTMPAYIDYRCYSHIISTILTMSSVEVLETFRQTSTYFHHSREVRRLINSKVYRHLGIDSHPKNMLVDYKEALYLYLKTRDLPPSYLGRTIHLPATDSDRDTLLVHTKILDIMFDDCNECDCHIDSEYPPLPSLKVLRVFGSGSQGFSLPPCTTVIVLAAWVDLHHHHVLVEPPKMKRIVFPIEDPVDDHSQVATGLCRVHWLSGGEVEEVVVINTQDERMSRLALKHLSRALISFFFTTGSAAMRDGLVVFNRVVFVEFEEERFREEWTSEMATFVLLESGSGREISEKTITERFRFHSYDEYLSTLGGDDEWLALVMD